MMPVEIDFRGIYQECIVLTDSIRSQRVFAEKNLITFGIYLMRRIFESVCERTTTVKTRVLYTHTQACACALKFAERTRVCVVYIFCSKAGIYRQLQTPYYSEEEERRQQRPICRAIDVFTVQMDTRCILQRYRDTSVLYNSINKRFLLFTYLVLMVASTTYCGDQTIL